MRNDFYYYFLLLNNRIVNFIVELIINDINTVSQKKIIVFGAVISRPDSASHLLKYVIARG